MQSAKELDLTRRLEKRRRLRREPEPTAPRSAFRLGNRLVEFGRLERTGCGEHGGGFGDHAGDAIP